MTGSLGVSGGIAKANLNVMQALDRVSRETDTSFEVLSLLDTAEHRPTFLSEDVQFRPFGGDKKAFALQLLKASSRNTLFCFDHVSLSLPLLPLMASGRTRAVIFNHGSESWKKLQRLNRLSLGAASMCLTNSNYTLSKMRQHVARFNGVACQLGLPPDFELNHQPVMTNGLRLGFDAADGQTRFLGDRVLLLVSRMHPTERQKGHRELINIMPRLLERFPNVQMVFAGTGDDLSTLLELARTSSAASSIFFPGFLPNEQLRQLYQHSYAFVMPSKQEGFGQTYLEAMNFAKPCIGCFDQGAEDVITQSETGFLVKEPGDSAELLTVLSDLLIDPERASSMGLNGFRKLHDHFTSAHHQARVQEHISALL